MLFLFTANLKSFFLIATPILEMPHVLDLDKTKILLVENFRSGFLKISPKPSLEGIDLFGVIYTVRESLPFFLLLLKTFFPPRVEFRARNP